MQKQAASGESHTVPKNLFFRSLFTFRVGCYYYAGLIFLASNFNGTEGNVRRDESGGVIEAMWKGGLNRLHT